MNWFPMIPGMRILFVGAAVILMAASPFQTEAAPKEPRRNAPISAEELQKRGNELFEAGKYEEAAAELQRLIDQESPKAPRGNQMIADAWAGVGNCRDALEDHLGAIEAWYRVLCIQMDTHYSGDGFKENTLFRISRIEISDEELPKAVELLERVMARTDAWRKNQGYFVLQSLARVKGRLGRYESAIADLDEAIARHLPSMSSDGPLGKHGIDHITVPFLVDRADMEAKAGQKKTAEQTLRKIMNAADESGFGDIFPNLAEVFSRLAVFAEADGRHEEARTLRARETRIRREQAQRDSLNNLPADARKQITALMEKFSKNAAEPEKSPENQKEKQDWKSKVISTMPAAFISKKQTDLISTATQALMNDKRAEKTKAAEALVKASTAESDRYQQFAIPNLRVAYLNFSTLILDLHVQTDNAQAAARWVLRTKGIISDSLRMDRQLCAQNEALKAAADQVDQLTLQHAAAVLDRENGGSSTGDQTQTLYQSLLDKQITLQAKLAELGLRIETDIDPAKVQAALAPDEVLIECVSVPRLDLMKTNPAGGGQYAALIIPAQGAIRWVELGRTNKTDYQIELYQKFVRGQGGDAVAMHEVLRELHDVLWAPIEKVLPREVSRVVICPDSKLSFVSWATLLAKDERYAAEKYLFRYVNSGRDLLLPQAPHSQEAVIFADPKFSRDDRARATAVAGKKDTDGSKAKITSMSFPRLPGTAGEAEKIGGLLTQKNWAVKTSQGPQASEVQFREIRAPGILHLGTHGFSLSPRTMTGDEMGRLFRQVRDMENMAYFQNPLRRNGFALADVLETFGAWSEKKTPPLENDGVVTCEDIETLPLRGTWLVSLASCDSGVGEVFTPDGAGLRRAFTIAGAQNILTALWPLSDAASAEFMVEFYRAALDSNDPALALAETQRAALIRMKNEKKDVLSTVILAGPFVMHSQGAKAR